MNILLSTADFKKRQSALTVHDVSPSSSDPYSRGRGKNEMCVLHPVWFFDILFIGFVESSQIDSKRGRGKRTVGEMSCCIEIQTDALSQKAG